MRLSLLCDKEVVRGVSLFWLVFVVEGYVMSGWFARPRVRSVVRVRFFVGGGTSP